MDLTLASLISLSFFSSVLALLVFIASLSRRDEVWGGEGAAVIFHGERASAETDLHAPGGALGELDRSSAAVVRAFLWSSILWLLLGSLAGEIASLKLHWPGLLSEAAWTTFGRIRPVHLNLVMYGWASMVAIGCVVWILPRLLNTPLRGAPLALAAAGLWNLAMALGAITLLAGISEGKEFLEIHWAIDMLFAIAGALVAVPVLMTFARRRVTHLYVSLWYVAAALVWFPMLMVLANVPGLFVGASEAVMNWWFGHNVLGLWITPLALGTAYYVIPKVLGVQIASYRLSLLGFWGLALFYSQVGVHHLIGGPVPLWVQAISVVTSVMMLVPVMAFAANMWGTLRGRLATAWASPALRFTLVGVLGYLGSSVQGSIEAIPSFNALVHFTHYTVGHAHFGMVVFFSFIMFGAVYFLAPRIYATEWPADTSARLHWWLGLSGIGIYVISLSIGGVLQGLALADPSVPFMDIVDDTQPWLVARSVGGALLSASHAVFAWNLWRLSLAARLDGETS